MFALNGLPLRTTQTQHLNFQFDIFHDVIKSDEECVRQSKYACFTFACEYYTHRYIVCIKCYWACCNHSDSGACVFVCEMSYTSFTANGHDVITISDLFATHCIISPLKYVNNGCGAGHSFIARETVAVCRWVCALQLRGVGGRCCPIESAIFIAENWMKKYSSASGYHAFAYVFGIDAGWQCSSHTLHGMQQNLYMRCSWMEVTHRTAYHLCKRRSGADATEISKQRRRRRRRWKREHTLQTYCRHDTKPKFTIPQFSTNMHSCSWKIE